MDQCLPRTVVDRLRLEREDVTRLAEHFPHDTPDAEWLASIGKRGWLAITHDKHIKTRPAERQAIIDNRVGCFILVYKENLLKEDIFLVIKSNLPKMEELFANTPKPFLYTVDKNGNFRKYEGV